MKSKEVKNILSLVNDRIAFLGNRMYKENKVITIGVLFILSDDLEGLEDGGEITEDIKSLAGEFVMNLTQENATVSVNGSDAKQLEELTLKELLALKALCSNFRDVTKIEGKQLMTQVMFGVVSLISDILGYKTDPERLKVTDKDIAALMSDVDQRLN